MLTQSNNLFINPKMKSSVPFTFIFSNIDTSKDSNKLKLILKVLLSSYLNKSGNLKIYIKTTKNVLIDIDSHIEIDGSFDEALNYVLNKLRVKDDCGRVLMSVVKNDINKLLEPNTFKYNLDVKGDAIGKNEKFDVKNTYAFFINGDEENCETRRVCDYDLCSVGICTRMISLCESVLN